jgi:hypothetical protein
MAGGTSSTQALTSHAPDGIRVGGRDSDRALVGDAARCNQRNRPDAGRVEGHGWRFRSGERPYRIVWESTAVLHRAWRMASFLAPYEAPRQSFQSQAQEEGRLPDPFEDRRRPQDHQAQAEALRQVPGRLVVAWRPAVPAAIDRHACRSGRAVPGRPAVSSALPNVRGGGASLPKARPAVGYPADSWRAAWPKPPRVYGVERQGCGRRRMPCNPHEVAVRVYRCRPLGEGQPS